MSRYTRGDIVVVPFPYSGAAGEKARPALVLASVPYANRTDYILGIISSQAAPDPNMILLEPTDVEGGALRRRSYLRPTYLYTTGEARITRKIGVLKSEIVETALLKVSTVLKP